MTRRNKIRGVMFVCAMLTLCVGCSQNTAKKEAAQPKAEATPALSDSLDFKVEAATLNQINLSWNQVRNAAQYVIIREELENHDDTIPGQATGQAELARLSAEETSYQDITAKAGEYYNYKIYAYPESSGQAQGESEEEDRVHLAVDEEIVKLAIEDVYWETDQPENIITSPSAITMMVCFNQNNLERIKPAGLEIYRGTSLGEMEKLAEIPVSQDELIVKDGEKGVRYVDEKVEAGMTYYYQARPYIEGDGKKEYGPFGGYMRKSAILPEGECSGWCRNLSKQ